MWAHQPSPESSQQFWVLKVTAGIAKSTTTPAHMTTSPVRSLCPNQAMTLWGSPKDFTVPITGPPGNAAQPEQQTSHPNRAATPPHHATEPNGAQESPRRVFKPDRKTVRSPEVQCAQYLLEIPVWPINLWYILGETPTGRHVIMMHYGNGDKANTDYRLKVDASLNVSIYRVPTGQIPRLFKSWNDNFPDLIGTITLSHKC